VNRDTIALYDANAARWASKKPPVRQAEARAFGRRVRKRGVRIDIGCGTGRYADTLGAPLVGLEASTGMLEFARETAAALLPLIADVNALPLRAGALAGAWAAMTYHHIERERVPMALADLHRVMEVGAPLDITMAEGDYVGTNMPSDTIPGRYFACWTHERLADVVSGAGFEVERVDTVDNDQTHVVATRARTLADTVGPGMRLLVCGLNPSVYAADRGVGYARPGNRFWKAAVAAGLVTRERDAYDALARHGLGMTDLVKRATVAASELTPDEYRAGAARVARLVEWLQPSAICFVGLDGYRKAINRRAQPGWQDDPFGGRPAYVMPSTSGLNAATRFDDLVAHLRAARRPASSPGGRGLPRRADGA
jgi:TDG/mug DNA glycosylase family protein